MARRSLDLDWRGRGVLRDVRQRERDLLELATAKMEAGAKADPATPVDTGAHRSSIYHTPARDVPGGYESEYGAGMEYSPDLERKHATGAGVLTSHFDREAQAFASGFKL